MRLVSSKPSVLNAIRVMRRLMLREQYEDWLKAPKQFPDDNWEKWVSATARDDYEVGYLLSLGDIEDSDEAVRLERAEKALNKLRQHTHTWRDECVCEGGHYDRECFVCELRVCVAEGLGE